MPSPPRRTRRGFKLALAAFVLIFIAVVGEISVRWVGFRPWNPVLATKEQAVEPGGTLFAAHPTLGYALVPGKFTVHARLVTWHPTHADAIHRVTRPPGDPPPAEPRDGVWIFGDSNSYGWAMEDDQTYAWLLQQKHPELDVVNFSVGGYST